MNAVRLYTLLETVRKRPGMYFQLGQGAMTNLVGELVSNSIDAFLRGTCTRVSVSVQGAAIEVTDDGDGLPFDLQTEQGESLGSHYLTTWHNTRSADDHAPHIHLHFRNGTGLAGLNAVATEFVCRSWRQGQCWEQRFVKGVAESEALVVSQGNGRGSMIRLFADLDLLQSAGPNLSEIRANLWNATHLFPGLEVDFNGERYRSSRGLVDLAHTRISLSASMCDQWGDRMPFEFRGANELVTVDAVALGRSEAETVWQTWVNGCETVLHGTHQASFHMLLKENGWTPALAMVHVVARQPMFAGPTKDRLSAPMIGEAVASLLRAPLSDYCAQQSP